MGTLNPEADVGRMSTTHNLTVEEALVAIAVKRFGIRPKQCIEGDATIACACLPRERGRAQHGIISANNCCIYYSWHPCCSLLHYAAYPSVRKPGDEIVGANMEKIADEHHNA